MKVEIDGKTWRPSCEEYDAIHAAAGAVLAGAREVKREIK